jgi:phosphate-selective porin OprO/OprP
MRKTFLALIAVLSLIPSPEAAAKTVEEVRKEKGVITEEEYKQNTPSPTYGYAPGKGFPLTSADRNFQLSLGGRGQSFYQFLDRETGQDVSPFRIRRFKAQVQGAVSWCFHDHSLKLQGDYTNIHTQNGTRPTTSDQQLRIQAQRTF